MRFYCTKYPALQVGHRIQFKGGVYETTDERAIASLTALAPRYGITWDADAPASDTPTPSTSPTQPAADTPTDLGAQDEAGEDGEDGGGEGVASHGQPDEWAEEVAKSIAVLRDQPWPKHRKDHVDAAKELGIKFEDLRKVTKDEVISAIEAELLARR